MRFEGAARHLLGIFLILVSSRQNLLQRTDAFSTPRVSNHGRGRIQQGSNSFESTWSTALKATPHDPAIRVQSPLFQQTAQPIKPIKGIAATLTKIGMMMYITSMCVALPIALFPPFLLHKMRLISKVRQEQLSLRAGQFCARWLLRLIPFCCIKTIPHKDDDPEPSIWVCNHASMLDVFMLLAADKTLRGKRKRPLKIVYWQQLEDNPVTKLLFRQCGFIPVRMSANKAGEDNDYDVQSFKTLLKQSKRAFEEGFDIGILPEGQLNPSPEDGLLPCFSGAFTLARMSKRPIQMMALHGTHRLWHAREDIGMTVTAREVRIRAYPHGRKYKSGDEFLATFDAVVGQFATKGHDLNQEELESWLDGTKWKELQSTGGGDP